MCGEEMTQGTRTQITCSDRKECESTCQCIPINATTHKNQSYDIELLLIVIIVLVVLLLFAIIAMLFCWLTRSKKTSSLQIQNMAKDLPSNQPQSDPPKLDQFEVYANEGVNEGINEGVNDANNNLNVIMEIQPGSIASDPIQNKIKIDNNKVLNSEPMATKYVTDNGESNTMKFRFDSDGDAEVIADTETTNKADGEEKL